MGLVWDEFGWSSGADRYSFAITDNGLYGTLRASGRPDVTLPMVAWEGMLDAVRTSRKAKTKSQATLPPRAGALWSTAESDQLAASFQSGASVETLAASHARTRGAIQSQLERLGLVEPRYSMDGFARESAGAAHIQPAPGVTGAAATNAAKPTSADVNTRAVSTNAWRTT